MVNKYTPEETMIELTKSNECGDWLIGEIVQTRAQLKSVNADIALAARSRLVSLKTAQIILAEFLTIQKNMLDAARHRRGVR
jgi:hypothetical protein